MEPPLDAVGVAPSAVTEATAATGTDERPPSKDGAGRDDPVGGTGDSATDTGDQRVAWDHADRRVHVSGVDKYAHRRDLLKVVSGWARDMRDGAVTAETINETSTASSADNINNNGDVVLKVKKPHGETWMVVHLANADTAARLVDYINDRKLTNKRGDRTLLARRLHEMQRDRDKRPPPEDMDDSRLTKRQRQQRETTAATDGTDRPAAPRPLSEDEVRDKVTPLWRLPPEEQLGSKVRDLIQHCALRLQKELRKRCRALADKKGGEHKGGAAGGETGLPYDWLQGHGAIRIAPVVPIPSAVRNKCEFTFGWRYEYECDEAENTNSHDDEAPQELKSDDTVAETNASAVISVAESSAMTNQPRRVRRVPAAGMMAGGWSGGVSRPHACANMPSEACALVDLVDTFLATSPLPPYDVKAHTGVWRGLTVRSSRATRECLVLVTHCPATGGAGDSGEPYARHLESEKARLLSLLTGAELPVPDQPPLRVTSVFFQEFDGISSPTPETPVQHAYGKPHLLERLGNCTFQVSPGAFFQVNTVGAEMLYAHVVGKVQEVACANAPTLLFDVCCGTGTIGICCLKAGAADRVVGVDISTPAIKDAQANAALNGLSEATARFVAGRAEDVLYSEIAAARREAADCRFVAVVDPAREGLHADVLRALRATKQICRIVYVSCNPTGSLVGDATLLCAPPSKRYTGRPFRVTATTPFDLFPLTSHCELVMVLDRITPEEMGATPAVTPAAAEATPTEANGASLTETGGVSPAPLET